MRRAQKKEILEWTDSLHLAHKEVRETLAKRNLAAVQNMLGECQEFAVSLGEKIEKAEGEGHITVSYVETYCESLFHVFEECSGSQAVNENRIYKKLEKDLIKIENSIKNDIRVRLEAVFLSYKASMWDSLESVYLAAREDPDCDAYCVPIPYFDLNRDGSVREIHYEGDNYPADVPVVPYDTFDFGIHRPDMVFIHNPYDNSNLVTTVHPFFYSENMKKFTDCLVYIPYYATSGGMMEGQGLLPAYLHADYIVVQSEKHKGYYDERIPKEKFLVFGSPKFDSVIHKCQNPPKEPEVWKERMAGRKVYFYNTSINGMLEDTQAFLKKMEYVFRTFQGREDACLLWRPHPLLDASFDSLRKEYKPFYEALKRAFVEEKLGIYDDTPHVEDTIALCDAYIGDSKSSITSLFGVAGKPLFLIYNGIHALPKKDDWRGEKMQPSIDYKGNDSYYITPDNQLWHAENGDYHYRFYKKLEGKYAEGRYYIKALEIRGKVYIIPCNAMYLLIIDGDRTRKIVFQEEPVRGQAFRTYWYNEKYIFLVPCHYPYLIRFDLETEKVTYVDGVRQFFVKRTDGKWKIGGSIVYGNDLIFASPEENRFLFLDMDMLSIRQVSLPIKSGRGTFAIMPVGEELWLMPYYGMSVVCWHPQTGAVEEYDDLPQDFLADRQSQGIICEERLFLNLVVSKEGGRETIILCPERGDDYFSLDRKTGKMERWELPDRFAAGERSGYFTIWGLESCFLYVPAQQGKAWHRFWHAAEGRMYDINIETKEWKEIAFDLDYEELKAQEKGFCEESEWMPYCLRENAFHSLKDFLDDNIVGGSFDRERQLQAFAKIHAGVGGNCGRKVYEFVKGKFGL